MKAMRAGQAAPGPCLCVRMEPESRGPQRAAISFSRDLPEIEPGPPALRADLLPPGPPRKPRETAENTI